MSIEKAHRDIKALMETGHLGVDVVVILRGKAEQGVREFCLASNLGDAQVASLLAIALRKHLEPALEPLNTPEVPL